MSVRNTVKSIQDVMRLEAQLAAAQTERARLLEAVLGEALASDA